MLIKKSTIFWLTFLFLKFFYAAFAIFIYMKNSELGDTAMYLSSLNYNPSLMFLDGTYFVGTVSWYLVNKVGYFPANFLFILLSFYGIYYPLKRIDVNNFNLALILLVLSFPSIAIWGSVSGKEAFVVFSLGVLLGYLIDILEKRRCQPNFLECLAFLLLFLIKIHFVISIVWAIFFALVFSNYKFSKGIKVTLVALCIVFSAFSLILTLDYFYELVNKVAASFSVNDNLTREPFWMNRYDVLLKAPEGILLSFFIVTLSEGLSSFKLMAVLLESFCIAIFILYIFRKQLLHLMKFRFNFIITLFFIPVVFWLLYAQYPFGVMNPGSAIRYRSGILPFILIFSFYINYAISWKNKTVL